LSAIISTPFKTFELDKYLVVESCFSPDQFLLAISSSILFQTVASSAPWQVLVQATATNLSQAAFHSAFASHSAQAAVHLH
jgi:hypothetical protein